MAMRPDSHEIYARRRSRNRGLGLVLAAFVALVFAVTVVKLGQEEDAWIGWVDYAIAKAGLFRLQLRVPERWNVASIGAPNTVEDYQVSAPDANGERVIRNSRMVTRTNTTAVSV